jgi:hypothetical protein
MFNSRIDRDGEDSMQSDRDKAIGTGKTGKDAKMEAVQSKTQDLEPCDKPQAQEASRLTAADEACDDGVD